MDPISTALITAVMCGVNDVAKSAVKDAYGALKNTLTRLYGEKSAVISSVNKLEAKPNSAELQAALAHTIADTVGNNTVGNNTKGKENAIVDEDLRATVAALMEKLKQTDEGRAALGKFTINAEKIGVVGDNANIQNMSF